MKPKIIFLTLALALAGSLWAQDTAPAAAPPAPAGKQWPAADLDTMLAPIALYPDPLISQILPASTFPSDIVLAARYLKAGKSADDIEKQPWDDSVKAVAHYPDVLKMMDEKLEWTTELGRAVADDQAAVLQSVQRLRGQAKDKGNLVTTPQQVIVVTNTVIEKTVEQKIVYVTNQIVQIQPAQAQVIYVPQYNPQVVYVQSPPNPMVPLLTFTAGLALGAWMHHDCDWYGGGFYYHSSGWHGGYGGGGWGGNQINNNVNININNSKNNNINNINNKNNNVSSWKPQNRPGQPSRGGTSSDRGWGDQTKAVGTSAASGAARPGTLGSSANNKGNLGAGGSSPAARPNASVGNAGAAAKPSPGFGGGGATPAARPAATAKPYAPAARPANDAFKGVGNSASTRAASTRGTASRQAVSRPAGGGGRMHR